MLRPYIRGANLTIIGLFSLHLLAGCCGDRINYAIRSTRNAENMQLMHDFNS
ncbi:MAG: hypothetical protein ACHBN1_11695 [Heteroscytonema crispum UTEX LB 1556]